jgi:hypothetical protein
LPELLGKRKPTSSMSWRCLKMEMTFDCSIGYECWTLTSWPFYRCERLDLFAKVNFAYFKLFHSPKEWHMISRYSSKIIHCKYACYSVFSFQNVVLAITCPKYICLERTKPQRYEYM